MVKLFRRLKFKKKKEIKSGFRIMTNTRENLWHADYSARLHKYLINRCDRQCLSVEINFSKLA